MQKNTRSNHLFTIFTVSMCKISWLVTRQQSQALTSTESSASWYSLKTSSCFSLRATPNLCKKALLAPSWVDTNPKSAVVCLANATSLTGSEGCACGENSTTRGRFRMITFDRKVSMSDSASICGDYMKHCITCLTHVKVCCTRVFVNK